jgi:hypothetical protein
MTTSKVKTATSSRKLSLRPVSRPGQKAPTSIARLVGVYEDVCVPLVYLHLPAIYNCTLVRFLLLSGFDHYTHVVL